MPRIKEPVSVAGLKETDYSETVGSYRSLWRRWPVWNCERWSSVVHGGIKEEMFCKRDVPDLCCPYMQWSLTPEVWWMVFSHTNQFSRLQQGVLLCYYILIKASVPQDNSLLHMLVKILGCSPCFWSTEHRSEVTVASQATELLA